ncbi:MAG: vanadium-dependent haloperoxidase [Saprospiraceae bacterium]|nr:vanadium-dependent haloperoxidase [Saprospiraceae bacterium]
MQRRLHYILLISISIFLASCNSDIIDKPNNDEVPATKAYSNRSVIQWNLIYLDIEKDHPSFRPATTARALAYIHMAAYQTALPGMDGYKSISDVLNIPTLPKTPQNKKINYEIALNAAFRTTLKHFFFAMNQTQLKLIELNYDKLNYEYGVDWKQEDIENSIEWGEQVADAVIQFAITDGTAEQQIRDIRPASYRPPVGDGLWEPTAPDFGRAIYPFWGSARRFAISEGEMKSPAPPQFSTDVNSEYYKNFKEVYDRVKARPYVEQWIAEFWSDDITGLTFSPPARTFAIANQLVEKEKYDLEKTLHLYLKLGLASNDAAVSAWYNKYIYNVERPTNYITKYIDPSFKPTLGRAINNEGLSPAFPGYPSGHSTFGGVQEIILAGFFGENYTFTDRCHENRNEFFGAPRTYFSFRELAEENAYSRIYIGVHPRMDCEEGLRLGRLVAQKVLDLNFRN